MTRDGRLVIINSGFGKAKAEEVRLNGRSHRIQAVSYYRPKGHLLNLRLTPFN